MSLTEYKIPKKGKENFIEFNLQCTSDASRIIMFSCRKKIKS